MLNKKTQRVIIDVIKEAILALSNLDARASRRQAAIAATKAYRTELRKKKESKTPVSRYDRRLTLTTTRMFEPADSGMSSFALSAIAS